MLLRYLSFLILICFISACNKELSDLYPFSCDVEEVDGKYLKCNNEQLIKYANNQSDDFAKSGTYSAKIDKENPFGIVYEFSNLQVGNNIVISLWEKTGFNNGYLKICDKDSKVLISRQYKYKSNEEWKLIIFSYEVTDNNDSLKFYIHNDYETPAYYDDIKVEVLKEKNRIDLGDENVQINLDKEDMSQLIEYRKIAIENGVIDKSLKKYFKGTLNYKGKSIPIKIRFKGDWPDHIEGDKWSFRIKILGDNSFKGMKSFSIQSPHTREFLKEWILHKMYADEDVLATRYDFISVKLNSKQLGIYACEEHFDKQLLESNNRREAPILRFDEEGLWQTRIKNPNNHNVLPSYSASEVIPFKKNRTVKTQALNHNFKKANILMLKYKEFDPNLEYVFDLRKMAKYYALNDIGGLRHSYHWHNQRFYYDPISERLEHIAFDCYGGIYEYDNDIIFGYTHKNSSFRNDSYLTKQVFNNIVFNKYYYQYLERFSDPNYIDSVINKYSNESDSLYNLIRQEFLEYNYFDINFIANNAKLIRELLPSYKIEDYKYECKDITYDNLDSLNIYYPLLGIKVLLSNNIKSFDSSKKELTIENFHFADVSILGYGAKKSIDSLTCLDNNIIINKFSKNQELRKIVVPNSCKYIFFKPHNRKDTLFTKINKWNYNSKNLDNNYNIKESYLSEFFNIDTINHIIKLKRKNIQFRSNVIIPEGYTFVIDKGSEIDLINSASITSYSKLEFNGEDSQPIKFISSDKSGEGLIVLNVNTKSSLNYVEFDGLKSKTSNNSTLTGAITFYESNVSFNYCSFMNNLSEDALNIIRSNFDVNNCNFDNTFSDALDADFCEGKINKSKFNDSGNDAIDVSGSKILINNCRIINSKDKAISSGENSDVIIDNCYINNANIALASKDKSNVVVNNLDISNTNIGFAAFQKKPEFSGANINISTYTYSNVNQLFIIDVNSTINNKDEFIKGTEKINIDSLYY